MQITYILFVGTMLIACNSDYVIRSTDWRDPGKFESKIRKFEQADHG